MSKLSGVITAMPTPMLANEDVDVKGLQNVIDYLIGEGVNGIFVLGSMGEGPAQLYSQQKIVIEKAAEHINGRVPLLASISDISTRKMIYAAEMFEGLGADYFVMTSPLFYSFPHQDSILRCIKEVAKAVKTPLVFYNVPGRSGNNVTLETIEKIMSMPEISGIKDSSCDIHLVMELLRRYPDKESRPCSIFQGDENVYDVSVLMGVDGVITGGGTLFVKDLLELYKAGVSGDKAVAFKFQQKFRKEMDDVLGPELLIDWMHAIKKELVKKGLCEDNVTSPFLKRM